ncbi:hypothetical protein Tco_1089871 [Tanacetum coccineum]|uniref:Uncharacterized protein n=1 Tax=Tanacetum coccineum TaxID=301880 RepID=A0ABQ5I2M3_9ASTR
MSDLYDVKISVKLLPEIKGLLSMKPNGERLFRDTVFEPWLDIQSHENDAIMCIMFFNIRYLYNNALVFVLVYLETFGKGEIRQRVLRGLALVKGYKLRKKSDYEELFEPMSNPNVALISSPEEMSHAWFKASAEFIKGLDDQDATFFSRIDQDVAMLPTMSSNSPQAENAAVSKFFAEFDALKKEVLLIKRRKDDEFDELTKRFSKNDKDVCHLDDNMEIDGQNAKDGYSNSQHHLHLLIKALGTKTENPSYEQQANADKGKTTVIQETVGVTVEEQPSLGRGLGTLKFKKKNYECALRPNYVLRLCRNLPVAVDNDPLETALAYRERMLEFFWNHKILVE